MAEPFDHILSKYIEYGRTSEKTTPNANHIADAGRAMLSAKEQFGDTYTDAEYDQAMMEAQEYVYVNHFNKFTRIPE